MTLCQYAIDMRHVQGPTGTISFHVAEHDGTAISRLQVPACQQDHGFAPPQIRILPIYGALLSSHISESCHLVGLERHSHRHSLPWAI
jgi:hypothetical protein